MVNFLIGLFITGVLFSFGPCLYSCGPILFSYTLGSAKNCKESLVFYLLFSLSRILVYIVLSLIIFVIGEFGARRFLSLFSDYVNIFGGSFIVFIGILLVFKFSPKLSIFEVVKDKFLKKDLKNSIILGFVYGLIPCAPFLAVLSYIGLYSKSFIESMFFAFVFGLGTLFSPLILVSLINGKITTAIKNNLAKYEIIIRLPSAVIIIYLGVQLIVGR
jgi:sulfite exporter TauE/SafE